MSEGSTGVMIPRIHWNGTSKDELLRQLCDAHDGIMQAINVLSHATPHGRDYYVIDDNAIDIALKQHRARIVMLETVVTELEEMIDGINIQEKRG